MKLRVRDGSVRLRLTKSEVAALAEDGRVESSLSFGGGRALRWSLAIDPSADAVRAALDGASVAVTLPPAVAREWTSSDRVGVEGEQRVDDGVLRILVEKDFACLTVRAGEDDSDAYANPNESCR